MTDAEKAGFEQLHALVAEAEDYMRQICTNSECATCPAKDLGGDGCDRALMVKYLLDKGATVARAPRRLLVHDTVEGMSDAEVAAGWYNRQYRCPVCSLAVITEMRNSTHRVYATWAVLKENKAPKCCPECGTPVMKGEENNA